MNSPLSHAYAFVEPIREVTKGKKLFTIDINKCRRNILLNHKHDYCIFNVMDEPEEKERVLFIGTQFSILYTFMYSPA